MVNEENVKHLLTSWLNTFNVEVYWEKKNKWDYPTFDCDFRIKPDLIIKRKYSSISFAVEVKDAGDGDMNLLDASPQILKYAKTPIKYFINNTEIMINGFIVATQYSLNGHLYKEETIAPAKEGRLFAIKRRQVPEREYAKTLNFIRTLWRYAAANEIDAPTGALLSNQLNCDNSIAPMMFFKTQKWSSYMVWDKI